MLRGTDSIGSGRHANHRSIELAVEYRVFICNLKYPKDVSLYSVNPVLLRMRDGPNVGDHVERGP